MESLVPPTRPSHKELNGKLRSAREYIAAGRWLPAEVTKVTADFQKLDLWTVEEQTKAMLAALDEITPDDYAGSRPPQKAYEPAIKGGELTPFAWNSPHFQRAMYFKFCIKDEYCWIVSFHEDRDE